MFTLVKVKNLDQVSIIRLPQLPTKGLVISIKLTCKDTKKAINEEEATAKNKSQRHDQLNVKSWLRKQSLAKYRKSHSGLTQDLLLSKYKVLWWDC